MAGRLIEGGAFTWSRKAVDAALNLDLKDSDVIIATYPKTGKNNCCWWELDRALRCYTPKYVNRYHGTG